LPYSCCVVAANSCGILQEQMNTSVTHINTENRYRNYIHKINNFKYFAWIERAVLLRWQIHVSWGDAIRGHILEVMNTSNYYFTSCSLWVCLFRSRFRAKLSAQWQWKSFCVQCAVSSNWSAHWMPSLKPTHKALFTTLYHKIPHILNSVSERLLTYSYVYGLFQCES